MQECQVMIESAERFKALSSSQDEMDVNRSLFDSASLDVWMEIINCDAARHLDVAQNRTIPDEIKRMLVEKGNPTVRSMIAEKRKLPPDLFFVLSRDSDSLVRQKIAANAKTPPEILQHLLQDVDGNVARVARYRVENR
jgi:hypothetical protein